MKTSLTTYAVEQLCEGFVYNELEGKGLFGLAGKLVIQPEYQRNYIYADGKRDVAVIPQHVVTSRPRWSPRSIGRDLGQTRSAHPSD